MNTTFKQTQLLPMLTSDMIASATGETTFCPLCARIETPRRKPAVTSAVSTRLPRPQADRHPAELALLGALTVSAVFCIGQAAVTMVELAPNWPKFQAWVAQVLG